MLIEIRLLGRFEVHRAGREVPRTAFHGEQARKLLRVLAVRRGTFVSCDVLADAIWADRPPDDPGAGIHVLVHRVRRALDDPSLIITGAQGYWLIGDARCTVDVEMFVTDVSEGSAHLVGGRPGAALASFRSALAVWRGEPLAEDAYDEWAQPHRHHLQRAHVEALEGAAAALAATNAGEGPEGDDPTGVPGVPVASVPAPAPLRSVEIAQMAVAAGPDRPRASRLVELALVEAGDDVFARAYALGTGALLDTRHGLADRAELRWAEVDRLFEGLGAPGIAVHLRELAVADGLDMLEHLVELFALWQEAAGGPAAGAVDLSRLL